MSESARDRLRKILDHSNKPKKVSASPDSTPPTPLTSTPLRQESPRAASPGLITSNPPQPIQSAAPVVQLAEPPAALPVSQAPFTEASLAQPTFSAVQKPPATPSDLRLFLQELRSKMAQLAEDFAQGKLNRMQFQEIYAHYQKQRQAVEEALINASGPEMWQSSVRLGMTGLLRERHAAKILSYAIYDNVTSLPLGSVGTFRIDTSLLVPMLSSFRSAATEMFGAGLRSTEIEGGHWLCFVPGNFSTLIVLFSVEPARVQLTLIEDLHRDFEIANQNTLESGRGREAAELFTRIWALDKAQMY